MLVLGLGDVSGSGGGMRLSWLILGLAGRSLLCVLPSLVLDMLCKVSIASFIFSSWVGKVVVLSA